MGERRIRASWIIVALSLVAVSGFAFLASSDTGRTIQLTASADTFVSSAAPTTVYGYQPVIWVYQSGSSQSFGLLAFNVGPMLPKTDVLVSARLRIIVNGSSGTFPATMNVGRLLGTFSESTTTYSNAPAWTFDNITSFTFDKRPGPGKTVIVDVTQQLMTWKSLGSYGSFGIVLAMDPSTANAGVSFASHENVNQAPPVLQIFTLPPGQYVITPPTGGLLAIRPEV